MHVLIPAEHIQERFSKLPCAAAPRNVTDR